MDSCDSFAHGKGVVAVTVAGLEGGAEVVVCVGGLVMKWLSVGGGELGRWETREEERWKVGRFENWVEVVEAEGLFGWDVRAEGFTRAKGLVTDRCGLKTHHCIARG